MARNMPGKQIKRPAQGINSVPTKLSWGSPTPEPAPKVVSRGTLSKPVPLKKWNPGTLPQDRPGKIVQS